MSNIALAHCMQATEEIKRVIDKRLPEIKRMEKTLVSLRLPVTKQLWNKHLLLLSETFYAEATVKNKKCLQEGFGEKTDPRLDSFVDYLVANRVDKELVENAIAEQFAMVDIRDQHGFIQLIQSYVEIQQSAKRIIQNLEAAIAEELDNWHKCYSLFRTANGLFLIGIDCMARGDFVIGLEKLTECYLLNKRLEEMTPTASNRYKTMNRRGFYVNLCVQYCNEYLLTRYETGAERDNVVNDVRKVLVPAIIILQEKAIASTFGAEDGSLKDMKRKWEDMNSNSKNNWMDIIQEALANSVGTEDAGPLLSKHRLNSFQRETGSLALNKFYGGYMDIVRQWKTSVGAMGLEEMRFYVEHNLSKMAPLDFYKKVLDDEKNTKQILVRMGNIKKDGEQIQRVVEELSGEPTRGRGGVYRLGRGRGRRVLQDCQNVVSALPGLTVVRGRGRGIRDSPALDVRYLNTKDYTLEKEETAEKADALANDDTKRLSNLPTEILDKSGSDINSDKDLKLTKKERKRRRKQLQNQQRLEELKASDENSTVVKIDAKGELERKDPNSVYQEHEVLDKLVNKFHSNLVITKNEVATNHIIDEFEEIAGRVIKRAENEFEKKITEIKLLKKEKETFEKNMTDLKFELVAHRNKCKIIFTAKSKELDAARANIIHFENEKDLNNKEIDEISAQMKVLEQKKHALVVKQNTIDTRINDYIENKKTLQTFLLSEHEVAHRKEAAIKSELYALDKKIEKVDENITNVKLFKTPVQDIPPKVNPNSMMIQFLEDSIQSKEKQLECPVCYNVAKAPIFSCSESHLVCGNCRPKLKLCPECRLGYKEQKRHRYAEMMAKELDTLRQQKENLVTKNEI